MTYTKKEYYLQYIYLAFRSPFSSYYTKNFSPLSSPLPSILTILTLTDLFNDEFGCPQLTFVS